LRAPLERSFEKSADANHVRDSDGERGTALIVDSGADPAPLVAAIEEWGAGAVAILRTHAHHHNVVPEDELRQRYGAEVIAMSAVGIPEPPECEAAVQVVTMCGVARNSLWMMRLRTSARRRSQSVADSSIVVAQCRLIETSV
jgi:hypothetical protein